MGCSSPAWRTGPRKRGTGLRSSSERPEPDISPRGPEIPGAAPQPGRGGPSNEGPAAVSTGAANAIREPTLNPRRPNLLSGFMRSGGESDLGDDAMWRDMKTVFNVDAPAHADALQS